MKTFQEFDLPKSLQSKLEINRGKIKANEQGQVENLDWLFVGGDIFRGPDLISGVADGHRAAKAIDSYLYKKAKDKEQYKKVEEMRESVRANSPELTPKQRGIK